MKFFWMSILIIGLGLAASDLFACPSGQSCPAGKDCVADSSLCVADSSSSTSGGTSSEPTTVKDLLGLILDPVSQVDFGSAGSGVETLGLEMDLGVTYHVNSQTTVGTSMTYLSGEIITQDSKNAPIPDASAWIWGDAPSPKF